MQSKINSIKIQIKSCFLAEKIMAAFEIILTI